jgi:putative membrane protein
MNTDSLSIAAKVVVGLISLLHFYVLVLEMFRWEHERTRKIFRSSPEFATASKQLAANLGLYNGFLASGLLWSVLNNDYGRHLATFFLGCVFVAGAYAAAGGLRRILYVQSVPAAVGLALTWFT